MRKSVVLIALAFTTGLSYCQVKQPDIHTKGEPVPDVKMPEKQEPFEPNKIYSSALLSVQPEYPGGIKAFFDYFRDSFDYKNLAPEYDNTKTIRVYIQFVIEKNGDKTNLKILRDPGYGAGREVERVLKADKTKWKPGMYDKDNPARASYNLPVTINPQRTSKTIPDVKTPKQGPVSTEPPLDGSEIICTAPLMDVSPSYPGGVTKFTKDITSAINQKNLEPGFDKQTLKVYVGFVIEKDGSVTDIKILKDPGFGIAKEIERVIKQNRTKWIPGLLKSKPIRSSFNIPIVIEQKK